MSFIKAVITIMTLVVSLHTGTGLDDSEILSLQQKVMDQYEIIGVPSYEVDHHLDTVLYEKVENAIEKNGHEESYVTLTGISRTGNLIRYELTFQTDGNLQVRYHAMTWRNLSEENHENAIGRYEDSFQAQSWKLSDKGYLFIQREFIPGNDGPSQQIGIRLSPLDPICRDYNRKYVEPVGYENCTALISDWSEPDFTGLQIMEIYGRLFLKENGCTPDLVYGENPISITGDIHNTIEEVRIPDEEFESFIGRYFVISQETLRTLTGYYERGGYYYTSTSFEQVESGYYPFAEVVSYDENEDGTVTMTVHEVDPQRSEDRVSECKLTLRINGQNDSVNYVRNEVITE